jgi:hypothetical protein
MAGITYGSLIVFGLVRGKCTNLRKLKKEAESQPFPLEINPIIRYINRR